MSQVSSPKGVQVILTFNRRGEWARDGFHQMEVILRIWQECRASGHQPVVGETSVTRSLMTKMSCVTELKEAFRSNATFKFDAFCSIFRKQYGNAAEFLSSILYHANSLPILW